MMQSGTYKVEILNLRRERKPSCDCRRRKSCVQILAWDFVVQQRYCKGERRSRMGDHRDEKAVSRTGPVDAYKPKKISLEGELKVLFSR